MRQAVAMISPQKAGINPASPGNVIPYPTLSPCFPHNNKGIVPRTPPINCAIIYPIIVPELILPRNQNASVTAGFIWAPLYFPTGEIVTRHPTVPNKKPVTNLRAGSDGMMFATGDPSPQLKITKLSPKKSSKPVPIASATNNFQSDFIVLMS